MYTGIQVFYSSNFLTNIISNNFQKNKIYIYSLCEKIKFHISSQSLNRKFSNRYRLNSSEDIFLCRSCTLCFKEFVFETKEPSYLGEKKKRKILVTSPLKQKIIFFICTEVVSFSIKIFSLILVRSLSLFLFFTSMGLPLTYV